MQQTKNPRIFIIEDSIVYKDLIVNYLKANKFSDISLYKTGDECMKSMHLKPDLIILDYISTGMTGLDLMLKVQKDHPEVDFIFLSGQNDVEVAVQIMKLGAADYIVKNEKAPKNLVKSINSLITTTKREKQTKGFRIGVVGFFVLLFLVIMVIILMSIFLELDF
ncbi:response regulator [Maribellus sediminis]|uniref:response regulator n=1 Tax=Maribellus sediminis TaxID=2696285 RepID=UPI001430B074|nr:response regulator [Maribellus sediminis]